MCWRVLELTRNSVLMSLRHHILLSFARIITMLYPAFKRQNDTHNTAGTELVGKSQP